MAGGRRRRREKFVDVFGGGRRWYQRAEESIGEPERGQQFRQARKSNAPGALETAQRRDPEAAALGEIVLPPRQRHAMGADQVAGLTDNVGLVFKR